VARDGAAARGARDRRRCHRCGQHGGAPEPGRLRRTTFSRRVDGCRRTVRQRYYVRDAARADMA